MLRWIDGVVTSHACTGGFLSVATNAPRAEAAPPSALPAHEVTEALRDMHADKLRDDALIQKQCV